MCIYFACRSCKQPSMVYCPSAEIDQNGHSACIVLQINPASHVHTKCETCKVVTGVINALKTLVFQNPWLETEGMAGLATKDEWEVGPGIKVKEARSIFSRGRVDEADAIEENLVRMGLGGLEGREALNEGEAWMNKKTDEVIDFEQKTSTWGSDAGTLVEDDVLTAEDEKSDDGLSNDDEMMANDVQLKWSKIVMVD